MSKNRVSTVIGELLLTSGVILLLFAFYEAYWTNLESDRLQEKASENLETQWHNPRGKLHPKLGEAFARMYIPTFGSDFQFAIIEGTQEEDLLRGPGRYTDSQMPGELGNFAVAGHRVGKGASFNDLANLETCDAIVVETQSEWITYRVLPIDGAPADCFSPEQKAKPEYQGLSGRHITLPGDVGVIAPVPGWDTPVEQASEALLTLTTCHPQFSNAERMIVHAMEVAHEPKVEGKTPAVLEES
ncbi:housekeeping sortase [Corynebacterium sp. HMSC071F07]|uniref:class E sortase n=1 Tax=Corynebacterium sp. HMSC071F07 TaxID=1715203 RepID=UPI0008A5C629|nr:class E sortase [Corynebacterium sp. HMSC071F07]OFL99254.1 housekeeping sortase [Corynebacterium sp. HMSC071F07]